MVHQTPTQGKFLKSCILSESSCVLTLVGMVTMEENFETNRAPKVTKRDRL